MEEIKASVCMCSGHVPASKFDKGEALCFRNTVASLDIPEATISRATHTLGASDVNYIDSTYDPKTLRHQVVVVQSQLC